MNINSIIKREKINKKVEQELIPLDSPSRWKEALRGLNYSFSHSWENAFYLNTGWPTYLYTFKAGDVKIVCPFSERSYNEYTDIVTPFGYSGFIGTHDYPDFQKYWKAFAQERGYVCGYIGLNPIFENYTLLNEDEIYFNKTLYLLNITLSCDELYKNLHRDKKKQLRGYERTTNQITTDKALLKDFFLANYQTYFHQKKADSVYDFEQDTLSDLMDLDNVSMVGIVNKGRVEAAAINTFSNYLAEALLYVSLPGIKHHTMPILWHSIQTLKKENIRLFNIGGGIKEGDSLAQYKQRLGGHAAKFKCLKQIYDQEAFTMLCEQKKINPLHIEGYFPPYRVSNN